jgi:pimeloyl-ACP methyl ester carboxylesterase
MTDQIVGQLRTAGFDHVGLIGHSAGSEVAELTAGLYGTADAIAALGYHHRPSNQIVSDFFTGDNPRALQADYEYFLGTPDHRQEMFFTPAADPAVVAADREAAVLTPSGEILSIGKQPSRQVLPRITVPVYLQLGDSDRLFEANYLDWERMQFAQSPAVTADIVPASGHTHMLHHAGPAATARLVAWFRSHRAETPPCN